MKNHKQEAARVAVNVPRGEARSDPNLVVTLNGVNYVLPRGMTSLVPAPVAEELTRAQRAREAFFHTADRLREQQ